MHCRYGLHDSPGASTNGHHLSLSSEVAATKTWNCRLWISLHITLKGNWQHRRLHLDKWLRAPSHLVADNQANLLLYSNLLDHCSRPKLWTPLWHRVAQRCTFRASQTPISKSELQSVFGTAPLHQIVDLHRKGRKSHRQSETASGR